MWERGRRLLGMLCIWRGAPDWPEGPPAPGTRRPPFSPLEGGTTASSRTTELAGRAKPGPGLQHGGNLCRATLAGAWAPALSVSVEALAAQAPLGGGRGAGRGLGEGQGAAGWWPRRHEIAADASTGEPLLPTACDQPARQASA